MDGQDHRWRGRRFGLDECVCVQCVQRLVVGVGTQALGGYPAPWPYPAPPHQPHQPPQRTTPHQPHSSRHFPARRLIGSEALRTACPIPFDEGRLWKEEGSEALKPELQVRQGAQGGRERGGYICTYTYTHAVQCAGWQQCFRGVQCGA